MGGGIGETWTLKLVGDERLVPKADEIEVETLVTHHSSVFTSCMSNFWPVGVSTRS